MTVTKLKTAGRLAPTPKPGSYIHAIYTTVEALGGRATCREIRELLPAANGRSFATNFECHRHVKTIGFALGYLGCDVRFTTGNTYTDKAYGDVEFYINTFDVYETLRIDRLARSEKHRKKREAAAKRRKAAAEKQAAAQAEMEATERLAVARQKLTKDSTNSTSVDPTPVTIEPAPVTRERQSSTMEYAAIAAASSFISVTVYALLGQVL